MAWTDDRVDLLKKYWAEGLSASQIAQRLGEVTRNAVIGKVHRLGLSGRATTTRMKSVRPRRRVAAAGRPKLVRPGAFGANGLKTAFAPDGTPRNITGYQDYEELVIPVEERKFIETLTESSCRWPIGDPQHKDFHFCNGEHIPGSPYCEFHSTIAFQPATARRRERAPQQQPVAANSN